MGWGQSILGLGVWVDLCIGVKVKAGGPGRGWGRVVGLGGGSGWGGVSPGWG